MPTDDRLAQFWVYESCDIRIHRPLSATNLIATLGQHLKQVNAELLSHDTTPLYTPAPAQGMAFVAFAANQARQRRLALNPQCKVLHNLRPKWWSPPNRNWSKEAQSWDEVNRNLHLSPHSWVRIIHQMRKVRPDVSVHREGTWIYILWSTTSGLCYIGQTGAKSNARTLHKRGMEHVRCALDYHNIEAMLQHTTSHLAPRNVYKHMHRHGPENFVITPLQRVSPREADRAEMWWMRRFGVSNLLNTIKPKDAKQKPWQWVLRRSACKPVSRETATQRIRQHIHSLLISRRIDIPLSEYLHLLTVARDILPPTDFRNFFQKADGKLQQRFNFKLPYSIFYRGDVSVRKRSARHNTCCACCFKTAARAARAERKQHTHHAQNAQNAQHGVLEADLEADFRHAQNA